MSEVKRIEDDRYVKQAYLDGYEYIDALFRFAREIERIVMRTDAMLDSLSRAYEHGLFTYNSEYVGAVRALRALASRAALEAFATKDRR